MLRSEVDLVLALAFPDGCEHDVAAICVFMDTFCDPQPETNFLSLSSFFTFANATTLKPKKPKVRDARQQASLANSPLPRMKLHHWLSNHLKQSKKSSTTEWYMRLSFTC